MDENDFDIARGEQPPTEQPEKQPEQANKNIKSADIAKQLVPKLSKVIEKKLSEFETTHQQALAYMDDVAKDLKNSGDKLVTSGDNLLAATQSYALNVERFNKRHISFADLPKRVKAYIFGGLFITLVAGFGLGVFGQEKLSVYDPSGGWHEYVMRTHLKEIQRCWSEARRTGQPTNCNVVEKP